MITPNKQHTKIIRTALLLGLIATIILQTTLLAQQCHGIRDNVLRLHIMANSDSQADQQLKYKVRDALLSQGGALLAGADNKEEAIAIAGQQLPALQAIAQQVLTDNDCSYDLSVTVADAYFNTRKYDTVTLPAGIYTALRVVIGEGEGKNWWCVMFPNLCIPAADEVTANQSKLEDALTVGQTDLVEQGDRYQIKFKTVEWFQSMLNTCRTHF